MTIKNMFSFLLSKTPSIYKKLLFGSIAALLLGLIFSGVLSYFSTKHEIDEIFDAALIDNSRLLKGVLNKKISQEDLIEIKKSLQENLNINYQDNEYFSDDGYEYEKKIIIQLWDEHKILKAHSLDAPTDQIAPFIEKFTILKYKNYSWKINTIWLNKNRHWLVVAERMDARSELSFNIAASVTAGTITGLFISIVSLTITINYGFKPLLALGSAIRHRHLDDLNPIIVQQNPIELIPVLNELNQLFERLSAARQRERDFLADAAHELRTPLAVIRLQVQQALQLPAEQQTLILQKLLDSVQRNQQVIEHMLLLARLEGDEQTVAPEKIYLSALIRETVAQMIPLALKYAVELQVNSVEADIIGDAALCMAMLRNLIDNALRHAPENSVIEIGC